MTRQETTNHRPPEYNLWHRTLPDDCPMMDIDCIEVRDGKVRAIVETGRMGIAKFSDWQRMITREVARRLVVPCFFVEYYINLDRPISNMFNVTNLMTNKIYKDIDDVTYRQFLMNFDIDILERKVKKNEIENKEWEIEIWKKKL